eukprot:jgi/Picsp_1/834/NSC_04322-R1_protein
MATRRSEVDRRTRSRGKAKLQTSAKSNKVAQAKRTGGMKAARKQKQKKQNLGQRSRKSEVNIMEKSLTMGVPQKSGLRRSRRSVASEKSPETKISSVPGIKKNKTPRSANCVKSGNKVLSNDKNLRIEIVPGCEACKFAKEGCYVCCSKIGIQPPKRARLPRPVRESINRNRIADNDVKANECRGGKNVLKSEAEDRRIVNAGESEGLRETCAVEDVGNVSVEEKHAGPDTAWWDPYNLDVVLKVKSVLHVASADTNLVPSCRENQIKTINEWLLGCLRKQQGDVMYLSGVPGTGKTLAASSLVQKNLHDSCSDPPPLAISINCMRLKTARDVVERIIAGFKTAALKSLAGSEKSVVHVPEDDGGFVLSGAWASLSPFDHLRKIALTPLEGGEEKKKERGRKRRSSISEIDLVRQTGMVIVILDEIDGMLEGKNCEEIVGSLFATAATPGSRLVLVGISNSIDLVQQLMRPGAVLHKHNITPKHVVFPTYLRSEVCQLLNERLNSLPGPVFDPRCIEFCARKIANGTGDMRRALEAAATAVDILVKETDAKKPSTSTETRHPVVSMRHMAQALSRVAGGIGASNENVSSIRNLPVPQQLIMCAVGVLAGETLEARGLKAVSRPSGLLGCTTATNSSQIFNQVQKRRINGVEFKKAPKIKSVTFGELEQSHRSLCSQVGVTRYSQMEFTTAIDVLCTLGLIKLGKIGASHDVRRQRVELNVGEDDVWMGLAEIPILKDIIKHQGGANLQISN